MTNQEKLEATLYELSEKDPVVAFLAAETLYKKFHNFYTKNKWFREDIKALEPYWKKHEKEYLSKSLIVKIVND